MTTQGQFKTAIAEVLSDPDLKTFTTANVAAIASAALAEIGRVAPRRFVENIDAVANYTSYSLLQDDFPGVLVPEIEVISVELFDSSETPALLVEHIQPGVGEYSNSADAGWFVREGVLTVPRSFPVYLDGMESDHFYQVRGYAPYVTPEDDDATVPLSEERYQAALEYCRVLGLKRLNSSRELFSQWQARSGNSDISPAGLMNALTISLQDWRNIKREIGVLREPPG